MNHVTKAYDFFDAITANMNLESDLYKGFAITDVTHVTDKQSIVQTTHGKYFCESLDIENGPYMRITTFV